MEHGQKGDQLQPAHHHVDDKDGFGPGGEATKAAHRADGAIPGTDVADGGGGADDPDHCIALDHRDHQRGDGRESNVKQEKTKDLPLNITGHGDTVDLDRQYRLGMDHLRDLPLEILQAEQHPHHLDAAACGSGAAADQHHGEEDGLRRDGPEAEIHRGKPGGGDDGGYLEKAVAQAVVPAVALNEDQGRAEHERHQDHDTQIKTKLFVMEQRADFSLKEHAVLEGEVAAGKKHEQGDGPGDSAALVALDGERIR